MEIEISTGRWHYLTGQLEEDIETLIKKETELDELCHAMQKNSGADMRAVIQSIRKEEEFLHTQTNCLTDMKIGLEKIRRFYQECEEETVLAGEADRKPFPENFRTMDLSGQRFVRVLLEYM